MGVGTTSAFYAPVEFIVPKTLEDNSDEMDVDGDDASGTPTVFVCSGELVEKVCHLIRNDNIY